MTDPHAAWLDEALGGMVRYHVELTPVVASAYTRAFHGDPVALEYLRAVARPDEDAADGAASPAATEADAGMDAVMAEVGAVPGIEALTDDEITTLVNHFLMERADG